MTIWHFHCPSTSTLNIVGSFHVKSTNLKKSSSMTISDFLHFAVYERHIIQEQNKKKLNLISPLEPEL